MSRGPTRRVRHLIASGTISEELLRAADHEADLAGHPYIDINHVKMGRLRLAGRPSELEELRRLVSIPVPGRWWKPLGPHSALRRHGIEETRIRRETAEREEHGMDDGNKAP